MSFFDKTRVLRVKTIFMFALFNLLAGATIHSAIVNLTPNFLNDFGMLSFVISLGGMSVCLGIGMYFLLADRQSMQKSEGQKAADV